MAALDGRESGREGTRRTANEFIAGWTGPAQVEKGVTESAGYAKLDVEYVDFCRNASSLRIVRRDIGILWRTVVVMARGEGIEY